MNFQRLLFVASLFIGSVCTSAAYGSSNPHLSADDCNVSGFTRYKMSAPKTDYEVKQQSDSAMQWMHDAKIGMFIHWGLYAGPARGEWNMNNKGIMPEEYRKLAYAESGDQYFDASLYILSSGWTWHVRWERVIPCSLRCTMMDMPCLTVTI